MAKSSRCSASTPLHGRTSDDDAALSELVDSLLVSPSTAAAARAASSAGNSLLLNNLQHRSGSLSHSLPLERDDNQMQQILKPSLAESLQLAHSTSFGPLLLQSSAAEADDAPRTRPAVETTACGGGSDALSPMRIKQCNPQPRAHSEPLKRERGGSNLRPRILAAVDDGSVADDGLSSFGALAASAGGVATPPLPVALQQVLLGSQAQGQSHGDMPAVGLAGEADSEASSVGTQAVAEPPQPAGGSSGDVVTIRRPPAATFSHEGNAVGTAMTLSMSEVMSHLNVQPNSHVTALVVGDAQILPNLDFSDAPIAPVACSFQYLWHAW